MYCASSLSLTQQHVEDKNGEHSVITDTVDKANFSMMNTEQETKPLCSYFPQTVEAAYMLGSAI